MRPAISRAAFRQRHAPRRHPPVPLEVLPAHRTTIASATVLPPAPRPIRQGSKPFYAPSRPNLPSQAYEVALCGGKPAPGALASLWPGFSAQTKKGPGSLAAGRRGAQPSLRPRGSFRLDRSAPAYPSAKPPCHGSPCRSDSTELRRARGPLALRSHGWRDGGGSKVKSRTRPRPCAKFSSASKFFLEPGWWR